MNDSLQIALETVNFWKQKLTVNKIFALATTNS